MSSEKGKQIIIEDGSKFRFHKMLRNYVQRWKCYLEYTRIQLMYCIEYDRTQFMLLLKSGTQLECVRHLPIF